MTVVPSRVGRTRRDGVAKLSGPPLLVLTSLADGPKHGHALMRDIEQFSGQRLGAGTLYGAIGRLVERELIVALPEDERRHPYEITPQGAALLAEAVEDMGRVVAEGRTRLGVVVDGQARLGDRPPALGGTA